MTNTIQDTTAMRVDLSPRLGGYIVANQPPTTVQSHELNLNLRFTLL